MNANDSLAHKAGIKERMSIVSTLIQSCICNGENCAPILQRKNISPLSQQFVELKGIQFICLGAVIDELTPMERVYDTLEVFRTKIESLISIGYLYDENDRLNDAENTHEIQVATVPLDEWNRDYPDSRSLTKEINNIINLVRKRNFSKLVEELSRQLVLQKQDIHSGLNRYLAGITAHNLGVSAIFADNATDIVPFFHEAIQLKTDAFGVGHTEVSLSRGELGIQLFAKGDFHAAFTTFQNIQCSSSNCYDSRTVDKVTNPNHAMLLNNIACCEFQIGKYEAALKLLEEALCIQHNAVDSSLKDELDLLHVAIVYANCGYLKLALKMYDEARSILEEALLIQQSVLDDNHRTVRDTLSNLEFANAFHS